MDCFEECAFVSCIDVKNGVEAIGLSISATDCGLTLDCH